MKEQFKEIELEIIQFQSEDVIITSLVDDGDSDN
jgi:hypothetical protein